MRPVLDDVEGTAVGADYTLSKRIGHGYTSFSGAWSELMTGIGRVDGAGVRRMVSVLRRKLLCTPGRSPGFEVALSSLCRVSSFPGLKAEWIFGDSSSFTVAGPHRDCTGLPFSALAGTLGLNIVVPRCSVNQPQAALTDQRVHAPVAFGQPAEQDTKRAPKQHLHLPGCNPEFPEQTRRKCRRYFIDSWKKSRKHNR